jgi:transcriptional regulator with XRE-family HTH domain
MVGAELRRLREASGITREAAGDRIRGSESKISRIELGRVSFKVRDVEDLLTLYGLPEPDPERDRLMELTRDANKPAWWRKYGDLVPSWFESYVGMESSASQIRTYEAQLVPGLLQTKDYARAVVSTLSPRAAAAEVEHKVELRMKRQRLVLDRESPPTLWVVVDEAALRRPIGGAAVQRAQLEVLVEANARPNITIQVMSFELGAHPAMTGSFSILRFPEEDLGDDIYVELMTRALYLDRQEEVDAYAEVMERLTLGAHPHTQTPEIIERILKELPC